MSWISDTEYDDHTLINKYNIHDEERLKEVENLLVVKVSHQLMDTYKITNVEDLNQIHYQLFKELYSWAGNYRTGNFEKAGHSFFQYQRFDLALPYLNRNIKAIIKTKYSSNVSLINDLAHLSLDINEFHPFREGNGRTNRLFIRILAKQKGLNLVINPNNKNDYKKYMAAVTADDSKQMANWLTNNII